MKMQTLKNLMLEAEDEPHYGVHWMEYRTCSIPASEVHAHVKSTGMTPHEAAKDIAVGMDEKNTNRIMTHGHKVESPPKVIKKKVRRGIGSY